MLQVCVSSLSALKYTMVILPDSVEEDKMSREQNNLQRDFEEYFDEIQRMREWVERAQGISPWQTITEKDWERFGHLTPEEWLVHCAGDSSNECVLSGGWDLLDEDWDDWDDWDVEDESSPYYFDSDLDWNDPSEVEFGGCLYPKEHICEAREYLSSTLGVGS